MQALTNPNDPRNVQTVVNNIVRQFDNVGSVTLTTGTTTVVKNNKINPNSFIGLTANTANAQGVTFWITYSSGQFTINHPASAATDRTFRYVIHGV